MAASHVSHTVIVTVYLRHFTSEDLQLILGLHWWNKATHSEIRSRAGIPSIKSMLLHRQLRWLGHVIRMPESRLPHHVLYGKQRQGHWSVGGQNKCFKDHIKSNLKKCNIPLNMLEALASDRATCALLMSYLDADYDRTAALRRRHQHATASRPHPDSAHSTSTLWQTMQLTHWPPQQQ